MLFFNNAPEFTRAMKKIWFILLKRHCNEETIETGIFNILPPQKNIVQYLYCSLCYQTVKFELIDFKKRHVYVSLNI